MRVLVSIILLFVAVPAIDVSGQIPKRPSEDGSHIMSDAYWSVWDDKEQDRIDSDIELYRKSDAVFHVGNVNPGTTVEVHQVTSDFVFGAAAFNWNQLGNSEANSKYRDLFGSLFNRATVPLYWSNLERKPSVYHFEESVSDKEDWWNRESFRSRQQPNWRRPPVDPIVKWCRERGVRVHGHPLIWGNRKALPPWLGYAGIPESEIIALDSLEVIIPEEALSLTSGAYNDMSPSELYALVPQYIKNIENRSMGRICTIMSRFSGLIDSYDVVNESAVDYAKGCQSPAYPVCKSSYGIMFPDYTFRSFKKAEECNAGKALLNINDYAVDKRYLSQIRDLLERGAGIDIAGSQMHLFDPQDIIKIAEGTFKKSDKLVDPVPVRGFFSEIGELGVKTCISEITIPSPEDSPNGEIIQAVIVRNLYRLWFSIPTMTGITWWNLIDGCGGSGEPATSGILRRNMSPKPVYGVLEELILHDWRTSETLVPDSSGNVSWRGFKGTYQIIWTDDSGKEHKKKYILE